MLERRDKILWRVGLMWTLLGLLILGLSGCATAYKPQLIRVKGYGTAYGLTEPSVAKPLPPPPELDWADKELTAIGYGAPSEIAFSEAQRRLMARRAAKLDALRNLAEQIYGVAIDSKTTVENFLTHSDVIKSQVDALIEGAEVVEEKELEDGAWEVRVALGLRPLAGIVERYYGKRAPVISPEKQPVVPPGQARAMARRAAQLDAYRNLLELVKGVQIKSGTTVEDFMLRDDRIKSRVEGILREARIVEEDFLPDGTCEVTVEFDLARVRQAVR